MSLETQLRDAFQQHEGMLPDRPGDLAATKRRGRRRRHQQVVLVALAALVVVAVPVWLVSATVMDDLVIDPAEEVEPPDEALQLDEAERVTMLLPNGDRVEVVAPPELPTDQVQVTAEVTTGDQPVLMIIVDPAWSDPAWPEELAEDIEAELLEERWGGELLEVTGTEVPHGVVVWRGQHHGVVVSPVVGTAADLLDALTLEERPDGVFVQVDPDLITDPGWGVVGVTVGEGIDHGDRDGLRAPERLAVTVTERTEDDVARARTDRGGQELDARLVDGGELYEDGDGRLRLVGDSAIVRNEFVWNVDAGEQQERMLDIMTSIRARWEPAGD